LSVATTFNALSKSFGSSLASTSLAVSRNRLDSSGSSHFGSGLRGIAMDIPRKPSRCHSTMKKNAPWGSSLRRFQRRHQRVLGSPLGLATSCFVSQSLAGEAFDRKIGAGLIVNPKLLAVGVPEIELGQIPVQVLLAHVEVAADDSALQDRKEAFDRVSGERPAHVFVGTVVDGFVAEVRSHAPIVPRFVGAEDRSVVDLIEENWAKLVGSDVANVEGANATAALDQRQDGFLAIDAASKPLTAMPVLFLAADVGFIDFHGFTFAAERAKLAVLHRFANTVSEKPSGFHAALEHPLNLTGRNALLAGAHQVDHLKPQVQGKVAILEDSPHADSEGATAGIALAKANPAALALQAPDAVGVTVATMRASRAIRPKQRLDIRERSFLIVEVGSAQNRLCHGVSPYEETLPFVVGVVKCNTARDSNLGC